jgi:DNA polymerase-3 subunit delta'
MAEGAANALLKTLEEPGDGLLILIAVAPDQLLTTIRSRCQQIPFTRLSPSQLTTVLERCGEAGIGDDPPVLVELAAGSPGALLRCRQAWAALPAGLADRLLGLAASADPWQLALWRRQAPLAQLQRLEQLRSQLRSYVQPRLAWEVALLELAGL